MERGVTGNETTHRELAVDRDTAALWGQHALNDLFDNAVVLGQINLDLILN